MTFWYTRGRGFEDLSETQKQRISLEWGQQITQSLWFQEGMRILDAFRTVYLADIEPTWVLPPDVIYPRGVAGGTLLGYPIEFRAGVKPHLRIDLPHAPTTPLGPFDPKDATP